MPILINSRIIQVREQIQCKVTWEYVPKDFCEDQVYSQLISMDESMKSTITNCSKSGISKCSLGQSSRHIIRRYPDVHLRMKFSENLLKIFQHRSVYIGQCYSLLVSSYRYCLHYALILVCCTMFARSKMLSINKATARDSKSFVPKVQTPNSFQCIDPWYQ